MFLGSCKIASKLTPCAEAPLRNFLSLVMVCIPILSPVPKITISFSCSFLVGFNFLALPDGLSGANSTHKCNFLNYTPAGASLQLVPNSEFTILSPSYLSHSSHNSKFKIHNLLISLALFKALYRLEKRLSLWGIKENSKAILLYFTNCKVVVVLTTHLIHYPPITYTYRVREISPQLQDSFQNNYSTITQSFCNYQKNHIHSLSLIVIYNIQ